MKQLPTKTPNMIRFDLPFVGFYDTYLAEQIDLAFESDIDGLLIDTAIEYARDLYTDADNGMKYAPAFNDIAEDYAKWFMDELSEKLVQSGLTSTVNNLEQILVSPKQYNFVTDVIFVQTAINALPALHTFELMNKGFTEKLTQAIRDKFTSRDGFYSFTPNEIDPFLLSGQMQYANEHHLSVYVFMLAEWLWNAENDNLLNKLESEYIDYADCDGFFGELFYKYCPNAQLISDLIAEYN